MQQLVILVISSFLLVSNALCMELDKVIKKDPQCPITLLQDEGRYLKELIAIENNGDFSSDLYTAEKTLQDFFWHNDYPILQELCDQKTLKLARRIAQRHEDYKKLHTALKSNDFHTARTVIGDNKYCLNAAYPRLLLSLVENSFLAEFLIMSGANVDQKDMLGKTSLFYDHHWAELWPCLLKYGAHVNQVDNQGNTSLYDLVVVSGILYADVCSHEKQISFLFNQGASPDVINKNGKMYFDIIKNFNISKKNFYQCLVARRDFFVNKERCVLQNVPEAGKDIFLGASVTGAKQLVTISNKMKRDLKKTLYDAADQRDFCTLQHIVNTIGIVNWRWQDKILRKIIKNHDDKSLQYCFSVGFSPEGLHKSDECSLLLFALRCDNAQAIELLLQKGYGLKEVIDILEESMTDNHKECTTVLNAFCFDLLKQKDTYDTLTSEDTIDFFA